MDYKSILTRDFKSIAHPELSTNPVRFKRLHVMILLAVVTVIGSLISVVSLDAKAKKHVTTLNNKSESKIIVPIDIPASA